MTQELRDRADLIMAWEAFEPGMQPPSPLDYEDTACKLMAAAAELERLHAALKEIERKYAAIMNDPPEWVGMTDEQLKWVREAWYGASLIARRALEQKGDNNGPA